MVVAAAAMLFGLMRVSKGAPVAMATTAGAALAARTAPPNPTTCVASVDALPSVPSSEAVASSSSQSEIDASSRALPAPRTPARTARPQPPARGANHGEVARSGAPNCDPPYTIDARGHHVYKLECD